MQVCVADSEHRHGDAVRRSPPESLPALLLVPLNTIILRMTFVCDGHILSLTLAEPRRRRPGQAEIADILASFAQFQPSNVALVTGNSKLEVRPLTNGP